MSKLLLITDDANATGALPPSPARVYIKDHGVVNGVVDPAVQKNMRLMPKRPETFAEDLRRTRIVWVEGGDFLPDSTLSSDAIYEAARDLQARSAQPQRATWLFNIETYLVARRWREWRNFRRKVVEPLRELGIERVGMFTAIVQPPVNEDSTDDWHCWEDVPVPVLHWYDIAPARLTAGRYIRAMSANPNAVILLRENDPNVSALVAAARSRGHNIILWDAWIDVPGGKRPLTPAERAAQNAATAALYAGHLAAGGA